MYRKRYKLETSVYYSQVQKNVYKMQSDNEAFNETRFQFIFPDSRSHYSHRPPITTTMDGFD